MELNTLEDAKLSNNIDIHIFEMKKIGKGWKTLGYNWNNKGIIDPYTCESSLILKNHESLSKIKENFEGTEIIACVIDGNLFTPSKLFQLIIECKHNEQPNIIGTLKRNQGLNYNILLEHKWINEIPSNILSKLLEY